MTDTSQPSPTLEPAIARPTLPTSTAIRLVAGRELRTRIVSKAFLGGLVLTVVLVVVGFVFAAAIDGDDQTRIGVVGGGQDLGIATLEEFAQIEDRELEIDALRHDHRSRSEPSSMGPSMPPSSTTARRSSSSGTIRSFSVSCLRPGNRPDFSRDSATPASTKPTSNGPLRQRRPSMSANWIPMMSVRPGAASHSSA